MKIKINISPRFKRAYKKLPLHIQNDFDKKIKLFIKNPNDPILKTHKLKGNLQTCLAFRLCDGYRILFEFSKSDAVDLLSIGPHDHYDKWKKL